MGMEARGDDPINVIEGKEAEKQVQPVRSPQIQQISAQIPQWDPEWEVRNLFWGGPNSSDEAPRFEPPEAFLS